MFVDVPSPGPVIGTFRAAGDQIQVVTALEVSCKALGGRQLFLTNHAPGVVPGTNTSEGHPAADYVVALGRTAREPINYRRRFQATTFCQTEVLPLLLYRSSDDTLLRLVNGARPISDPGNELKWSL